MLHYFLHVTLIRKLQSTSDLDYFHARDLPCSRVKSSDDPINDRRGDSAVPYSFICRYARCIPLLQCTSLVGQKWTHVALGWAWLGWVGLGLTSDGSDWTGVIDN